jgi:two-component system CheB/CheR fusion protein
VQALFEDFLISVTAFFRDPDAWEALRQQVVVPLVEQAKGDESLRAWVPACATGEEAYTLAILFREEINRRDLATDLVIFGSDVDQSALATARDGVYPRAIAADVPEPRLARYFRAEGDHYRVTNEIRDTVVFALHSVLLESVPYSMLRVTNQSKRLANLAYRDERLELGPGESVDLPLLPGGTAPLPPADGAQSPSAGPLAIAVHGPAERADEPAGVRLTAVEPVRAQGLGVEARLAPGETARFSGLTQVRAAPAADADAAPGSR